MMDELELEARMDQIHAGGFEQHLDGMIDATLEFILEDYIMADEERVHDLSALLRVRQLWNEVFKPELDDGNDPAGESPDPNWMND
jgi:hypothetical protein